MTCGMDTDRLRAYLAVVMADATGAHLEVPAVENPEPRAYADAAAAVFLVNGADRYLVWMGEDGSPAEELAWVADKFHEWLVEDLPSRGLATNWPPCPWHPSTHPLVTRVADETAVWACPVTHDTVARIGELAPST
jgi:hypothetical protein